MRASNLASQIEPQTAVVLIGGLGTRIKNYAPRVPKGLIPLCGEPFLKWKIEELIRNSITQAIFLIGYKGEMIVDFLSSQKTPLKWRVKWDHDEPLGTAGALVNALETLPEFFYLTYGDNLLEETYHSLFNYAQEFSLRNVMAISMNGSSGHMKNCLLADGKVIRYNKSNPSLMNSIDYGVSLLSRKDLESFTRPSPRSFDLSVIFSQLAHEGKLGGMKTSENFYEIGTIKGINETEAYLRSKMRGDHYQAGFHQI